MLTNHVHPRLGLPRFLVFEPYFLAALEAFDKGNDTLLTTSGGLSPSTIAARMRDSLQGYRLNHKFWGPAINVRFVELFTKHDGSFVIAGPDPNMQVWFRARHKRNNFAGQMFHEVQGELPKFLQSRTVLGGTQKTLGSEPLRATNCHDETVRAFVALKFLGELLEASIIFPGPISSDLKTELTAKGDIAFHFDEIKQETVLT